MKRRIAGRRLMLWLSVALSLALANGTALAAGGRDGAAHALPLKMAFRDGHLTAWVVAAPLHEVLAEISRLTGAEVRWLNQRGDERVSLTLMDVPLHEALERILKKNFTLSYASSGILTGIWIMSRGNGDEPAVGLQAGTATDRLDDRGAKPSTGRNQPRSRMDPDVGIGEVPAPSGAGIDIDIDIAEQPLPVRIYAIELLAMHADKDEAARVLAHVAASDVDPQVRAIASMALLGLK